MQRMVPWFVWGMCLAGCGSPAAEIQLALMEDKSLPCLGASHLQIAVISAAGGDHWDYFGRFFDYESYGCSFNPVKIFDLSYGRALKLDLTLWDSTTDTKGQLSRGSSVLFDVHSGSPLRQLDVTLARLTETGKGTLMLNQPKDWADFSNIAVLQFQVTPIGESVPARAGVLAYDAESPRNSFPMAISNLGLPPLGTHYEVNLVARSPSNQTVTTWRGDGFLGPTNLISWVSFQ